MTAISVLVADADDEARGATASALEDAGMAVSEASAVEAARSELDSDIDCLVTEYAFPDGTGLDLLSELRSESPDTPCVLFTDAEPSDIDTTAFEDLVVEYLRKDGSDDRTRLRTRVDEVTTLRTQVGYPLPDDEDARLDAIAEYDVENLAVEETLDRLTELAARHFGTDRAFIGLVHEHDEEFVSCHGGTLAPLARENTMCTHAILEPEIMVVEDTQEDTRFEHNDALDRLDIRSYVGAPMRTEDGRAIGSFCLTHDEPRTYSEADREYLRLLADEAMEQLRLRRRLDDTEEHESR
ncbi:GAF domain-containing protein [Halorientalis salina]|uniref:GAF domain-containing protein n=1 Tax=Halorientalis salina TaxID=2932266 RepID=UPI00145D2881|nr:GAF domain-containing protein [Halorientalis salina]